MGRFAVERRPLVGVLAVGQVAHLLHDDGQPGREPRRADVIEVARHLRVVGRDHRERLGRQALAELRRDLAKALDLVDDLRVLRWVAQRCHAGIVARRRGQERDAADIDHLDGLVDGHDARADLRRERLDVDDHDVDQSDALRGELFEVRRHVATREDPGVDLGMEGLDLAADERRRGRERADRLDRDAVRGERFARAVGGEDLDAKFQQVTREGRDAIAVRDRNQGSQTVVLHPSVTLSEYSKRPRAALPAILRPLPSARLQGEEA